MGDDARRCPKCGRRLIDFVHVHLGNIDTERAVYRGCPVHDDHCERCPRRPEDAEGDQDGGR